MASEKEEKGTKVSSKELSTGNEPLPPYNNNYAVTQLAATEHLSLIDPDCNDALLDSMDGCVDYVEGINSQYASAENLQDVTRQPIPSLMALPQELDYLNLCGVESDARIGVGIQALEGGNVGKNPSSPSTSPSHSNSQAPSSSCAICLEEETDEDAPHRVVFAKLPCCGKANATSTVQICTSCIILLSSPTASGDSRVGKCPRCRSWIVIATPQEDTAPPQEELRIKSVKAAGQCRSCNQIKDHLVEEDAVCDACFFGRRCPLLYECGACHTTQRIPHPMYRYQPSPVEFGTVTWACHGWCGNFTKWRILPDQVRLISVGDTPEVWGSDFVEVARARLQLERQLAVSKNKSEQCFIL